MLNFQKKKAEDPLTREPPPELKLIGADCQWYRVILDEAQAIKNKNALCAYGAFKLKAQYRLSMTGTPMMNGVQELYSQIRFLQASPYDDFTQFNRTFRPLLKGGSNFGKKKAMERLQIMLKSLLLRRTKKSTVDGKPIINLKERILETGNATFDEDQQAFYDALEKKTQLQFNKYLKANTIGRNYSNILLLLLRLRQACDHPHLLTDYAVQLNGETPPEKQEEYASLLSKNAVTRIKEADGKCTAPGLGSSH